MSADLERLGALFGHHQQEEEPRPDPDVVAETLRDALASYDRAHEFQRGDLVTQKSGLRRYRYPEDGVPAIFLEYVEPRRESDEHGDDAETEDCLVGVRGANGMFHVITAVSHRFEPWAPRVA